MNNYFIINVHIKAFTKSLTIRDSSKNTYISQLKSLEKWLQIGEIHKPNEQTIIDYLCYLKQNKKFSELSMNGYLATIKSFFSWLSRKDIYPEITKQIPAFHIPSGRKKKIITQQQTKKLLHFIDRSTLEGKRDFALISLIVSTGLRNDELTKLERGDLASCCGSHLLWREGKDKRGKTQHISLSHELFAFIQEYLIAIETISDSVPLFASHSSKNFGQRLTPRSISRIIKKRLEYAKIMRHGLKAIALR